MSETYHQKFDDGRHYFRRGDRTLTVEHTTYFKSLGISFKNDEDITLGIYYGFGTLYLSYDRDGMVGLQKRLPFGTTIFRFELDLKDLILSVDIWNDEMNPESRHWYINIKDKLLGHLKVIEDVKLYGGDDVVIMPEARYPVSYTLGKKTWKRKRWLKKLTRYYSDLEIDGNGVPVPGKGTMSYNCGDDAITSSYRTHEKKPHSMRDVLNQFAISCLETRAKYSTIDWLPKEDK